MKPLLILLLALISVPALAQRNHDALTERETELMRDSAQEPKKRIDLLLSFASERLLGVERLQHQAKPSSVDLETMARLLEDFAALIDELDDNLTMYHGHSEDLRRALRRVISLEAEMKKRLEAVASAAGAEQQRRIFVAMADARDSLGESSDGARQLLAEQIEKKGEEKDKEKLDREEARQQQRSDSH